MKRIAACITPHGYGHATRTIATLQSLQQRYPALRISLFTDMPPTLFTQTLNNVTFHQVVGDVGIVQQNALHTDIPATIEALALFFSEIDARAEKMVPALEGCPFILCDIAPLGIVAGKRANIPSVLVENFTWDWIYQPLSQNHPGIRKPLEKLAAIYQQADYHIQVEPVCHPVAREKYTCPPVFRKRRSTANEIRVSLGVSNRRLIVISMGGTEYSLPSLSRLVRHRPDLFFVVTGQQKTERPTDNCLTLARNTDLYHPDLIAAADLVVCKSGYSTVAECYQGGIRMLMVSRPDFSESEVIADFVRQHMAGKIIGETVLQNGEWATMLDDILRTKAQSPAIINGADCIADFLVTLQKTHV